MLKKLPLVFFLFVNTIFSQTFTQSNANVFPSIRVNDSDVGDYDNDGDLDIIIMGIGWSTNLVYTNIYDNDGAGNFSLNPMVFTDKYTNGQIEFVDYDNDNDLDIFMSGLAAPSYTFKSKLFENNAGVFIETSAQFGGDIINNQFAWSDLDNDGDLDLVLMGDYQTSENYSYIYRNDGNNNFVEFTNTISAYSQGDVKIADLDNDGDNDLVFGGLVNEPYGAQTDIYRNDGGFNFVYVDSIDGIMNGDMQLRDCNNDGLIDILRTGYDGTSASTSIYLNSDNFVFSQFAGDGFTNSSNDSNMVSADYSGNGELDILFAADFPVMYVNNGNMSYSVNALSINNSNFTDVEIGDFDNDNDIDLFIAGIPSSRTFKNQMASANANTEPLSPSILNSNITIIGSNATLSWNSGSDIETENTQLSYNLYVGTSPGATDIVTPMSDLSNCKRKNVTIGNMQYKNETILKNLPSGTYYWSVQSIDNQYEGSSFAPEQSFVIDNLSIDDYAFDNLFSIYPNPVHDRLNIDSKTKINDLILYDITNKEVLNLNINSTSFQLDTSVLTNGLYFLKIKTDIGEDVFKLIKK